MKLFPGLKKLWVNWLQARQECARMARVEQELQIQRELDWLDSKLGETGTRRVLTSSQVTEAVSNEFFRRHHS